MHNISPPTISGFSQWAQLIESIAKSFYARGWLLGTSGNLSAVVNREPMQLAITPSGVDKGDLTATQILLIDERAHLVNESLTQSGVGQYSKPSDESLLHVRIVTARGAGAVLHTHSIWNTILSDLFAVDGGLSIAGYEMLKGLSGVSTHEHREWVPIIENSQDMAALADNVSAVLEQCPNAHGFLLRRHGLYSWGKDLHQAKRHIEILEFLLETLGRTLEIKQRS
jgi:methylthioribulose-1-phosphate dehydratase